MDVRRITVFVLLGTLFAVDCSFLLASPRGEGVAPDTWWSFSPVIRPELPQVSNAGWPKSPLDRFVLARLEAEQIDPSAEADRVTLLRRVTLDLTGLTLPRF